MANKIGGIYYSISANAQSLYAELNKSKKSIGKFAKQSRDQINQVGKSFGVMGAAAAGATAVIVKSQLDAIDALAKTSDKLGVTTEGLAGLRFAAEQTGVASNQLDMGLQRMTRRIAEAAKGTGEAKAALAELGLNAQELSKLPLDKQFQAIAGAMEGVESQSDKIRLGFKLFDSEGVNLINTLRVGEDGLQAFADEAEALGIAVSRTDAAKIEAANNALNRAAAAADGAAKRLTVDLAPVIEAVADEFVEMSGSAENMGSIVVDAVSSAVRVIGVFADGLRGIEVLIKSVSVAWDAFYVGTTAVFNGLYQIVTSQYELITTGIQQTLELAGKLPDSLGGAEFRDAAESVAGFNRSLQGSQEEVDRLQKESVADLKLSLGEMQDLLLTPLPSTEIEKRLTSIRDRAAAAAAETEKAVNTNVGTEFVDVTAAPLSNDEFEKQLSDRVALQIAASQELAASELAIDEALDAQKIEGKILTNEKLLELARQQATDKVLAEFEAEQAAKGELGLTATDAERLEQQKAIGDETVRVAAEIAAKRAKIAQDEAKTLAKFDTTTFNGKASLLKATLGLASGFNKKSEKLQKAALLANKAIAIKDSIVAITGGIAKALNNPYPANLAFAASVAAQGAGLLSTLSSVGAGGGGSTSFGGSTFSAPDYAANTADDPEVQQRQEQSGVQLIVNGDINGLDSYLEEKMLPALESVIKERDYVFISADSRQGQELANAS